MRTLPIEDCLTVSKNLTERNSIVQSVRGKVHASAFFVPARSVYRLLFHPQRVKDHRQMRRFYSQFIRSGDMVFDVGAAMGEYAEVFCQLGARVIAVEPNPARNDNLYALARHRDLRIEGCAIGASAGAASLHLCDEPAFCTLSERWKQRATESGSQAQWLGTIEVPVTTLDALAERHGMPSFIKIDVEGYEEHVLDGMTFEPAALSFEFSVYVKDAAERCLLRPMFNRYEFNAIAGRDFEFAHDRWTSAAELMDWIRSLDGAGFEYGDIFARKRTGGT